MIVKKDVPQKFTEALRTTAPWHVKPHITSKFFIVMVNIVVNANVPREIQTWLMLGKRAIQKLYIIAPAGVVGILRNISMKTKFVDQHVKRDIWNQVEVISVYLNARGIISITMMEIPKFAWEAV